MGGSVFFDVLMNNADNCMAERNMFGCGSVMVWSRICSGCKTPLVVIEGNLTVQRYIDVILQPVVVSIVRQHNVIFLGAMSRDVQWTTFAKTTFTRDLGNHTVTISRQ
ncbi:hypothetical protein KP79_PYT25073 [Mizuhopecten yessoensis]|uniref:Uncharacterized protein n=1 Tax=Mizuhopecten yessoensis TaxID=6573 RepID=A0A210PWW0_MIZYE|nr:hypothetical protein KP79_PYT25073 [Mizuhopecten yessoensis]